MQYAVNTSFNVIETGDGYFSCYQGAWFAAPAPAGPWTLAATVPAVIYTIPPSNPMYPCTYVRVYAATPDTRDVRLHGGLHDGLRRARASSCTEPVTTTRRTSIRRRSRSTTRIRIRTPARRYYNAATGAWAQGGAIYGPYGGVAKAGYAYNPNTGA